MSWLPRLFFRGIWMPKGDHRGRLVLGGIALFCALLVIFVCLPEGTDSGTRSFIVKRGTKVGAIARSLQAEHFVRSQYLFMLCSSLLFRGRVVAGEYELSSRLAPFQIARKMARGERKVYILKIVEGYNIYQIGDAVQKAEIMDRNEFLQLTGKRDFLDRNGIDGDSLEGYLSPDTYFFSKETDFDEFLDTIVQRTLRFFERAGVQEQMEKSHMSLPEVLSLASIIEKEAKLEREKKIISAVFHNRLRIGMTLDADPTVIYGQRGFNREIRRSDLLSQNPYNTYRLKGLPKGPICSPSAGSIMAALYPEQTNFLYFVSRNDGSHIFSTNLIEHNHNVMLYQRHKNRTRGSDEVKKRRTGGRAPVPLKRSRVVASS
jgi:UPF0755 protein